IGEERIQPGARIGRERSGEWARQRIGRRVGQRDRVDDDVAQPIDDRLREFRQNDPERIDLVDFDRGVAYRQGDGLTAEGGALDDGAVTKTKAADPAQVLIDLDRDLDREPLGIEVDPKVALYRAAPE